MKISEVVFALLTMQKQCGDIDVCIEKKKGEFVDVKEVLKFSYKGEKESFIAMSEIKFEDY
ncbi:hypothetical protein [Cetobacterium sp.]|uniref:hypothetical protein n=1 Tax=Cetobacterium sp. TaxID=2071632 RepID=UPI003F2F08F4